MSDTYKHEEVQEILHSMECEQTKPKDLEERLEKLKQNTPHSEDLSEESTKIKQSLLFYKKKNDELVAKVKDLLSINQAQKGEIDTLKTTQQALTLQLNHSLLEVQQLQQETLNNYHEKNSATTALEDAQEDLKSLKTQHIALKDLIEKSQKELESKTDENALFKQKEVQLERVIQFLRKRSEEAHLEVQELTQELSQIQIHLDEASEKRQEAENQWIQLQTLYQQLVSEHEVLTQQIGTERSDLNAQLHNQADYISQIQEEIANLKEQNISLLNSLNSSQEALVDSQKEIEVVRQTMLKNISDSKRELILNEQAHAEEIKEIEQSHQRSINNLNESLQSLQQNLSDSIITNQSLRELHDKNTFLLEEKEREVLELLTQCQQIEQTKQQLQSQLTDIQSQFSENEIQLKAAQVHLAKKVRETALLSESYDEQRAELFECQSILSTKEQEIHDLKHQLNKWKEEQKNSDSKLEENTRQRDYLESQLESMKSTITSLKQIEMKYQRLQEFFYNVGGPSISSDSPSGNVSHQLQDSFREPSPPSLFDVSDPKRPSRYKDSFFE